MELLFVSKRARAIRERIHRGIGIPCCVGIAPTKTLAKLANHVAKDADRKPGSYPGNLANVCNYAELSPQMQAHILRNTPVGDVWGVGKRIAKKLAELGIVTAAQLSKMPPRMAREQFNVVLERTVLELQGIPCIDLELQPPPKQQIACTRSFGKPITHQQDLVEAVSEFASRAGEKLRKDQQHAAQLYVFAHTSPHREGPRFYRGATLALNPPTADTARLVDAAVSGTKQIYEPGFLLAKAGVILQDLCPASLHQGDLLLDCPDEAPDRSQVMQTIDSLNTRYGKGTVHIAGTGMAERVPGQWRMKQARRTPNYTTNLDEVPICRA